MKNLFIPAGSVTFPGDREQLLKTIQRVNGVLDQPENFHCNIRFPPQQYRDSRLSIGVRGSISYMFRCRIEQQGSKHIIHYKVYPAFSSGVFLFAAIYSLCSSFLPNAALDEQQRILALVGSIILFLLVYFFRVLSIKTFIKIFTRKN